MALLEATALHAAALAHLHALAFPAGEQWGPDAMALQLGAPGAFGWIDPRGGMILARTAADQAEVLTLAVDPAARRCGVGRSLVRQAMASAGGRGAAAMFLEVGTENGAARALYAALGFQEVGRRRLYYRGREDALILRAVIACESRAGSTRPSTAPD